jgi:hypothetical protein
MPMQARLDAPGTLHHVIVRGIEKRRIVDYLADRDTPRHLLIPVCRQEGLLKPRALTCCANLSGNWALYAISVRQLTALHSGFLQTPPQVYKSEPL